MLSARAREVSRAGHGDRSCLGELGHDGLRETRDRVGQEYRLRADANEVTPLGEGRDQLAVEAVLGLELSGGRRLKRLLRNFAPSDPLSRRERVRVRVP